MATKPDSSSNIVKREPISKMSAASLKAQLQQIDDEINKLASSSLQQIGTDKPFNSSSLRLIASHEAKKHRLLLNRLAALLKKGHPEANSIVEKLITIEI